MGRFNFEAYDAEVAEKKLQQKRPKIKTFVPLETLGVGRPQSTIKALMRFSKSSTMFTVSAVEQFQSYGQYVEFMLQGNLLVMRFLPEPSLYSNKLYFSGRGKRKCASVSLFSLRKKLERETDYVNFDVYDYEFLFCHDEKNIFYIELDRPFNKQKREKKRTKQKGD